MRRIIETKKFLILIILMSVIGCRGQAEPEAVYPNRPIKLVVPFAPGGSSDTFARVIQKAIEDHRLLPQPVVIINRGGAGGTIGSRYVKESDPDGYTILLLHDAILTAKGSGNVEYGPEAFEPILGTGEDGEVIAVRDDSPFHSLDQLLAAASSEPETITFAVNFGAPSHVTARRLERASGSAQFRFVQSGGGAERLTALLGEHVQVSIFSVGEYLRFRPAGLRALAVFEADRHPAIPEVPTARESNIDVISGMMQYWWAPKDTPKDRTNALAHAIRQAMDTEQVREALRSTQTTPTVLDPRQVRQRLAASEQRMQSLDRPQADHLKWYPHAILGVTVLLAGIVGFQMFRGDSVSEQTTLTRPAIAFILISIGYVAVLGSGIVGFQPATISFVLLGGGCLTGLRPRRLLVLAVLALLLGIGLHVVMTSLVAVDLP